MKSRAHVAMLLSACALAGCASPHEAGPRADCDTCPDPRTRYQKLDWFDRRQAEIDASYSDCQRRENKREREEREKNRKRD